MADKILKANYAVQRVVLVNSRLLYTLLLSGVSLSVAAAQQAFTLSQHPIYVGFLGGFGSTTWNGLVPEHANLNEAITLSTPTHVEEGGGVWGAFVGYELFSTLALELTYLKYPHGEVFFDPYSLFSFTHDELTTFSTNTETLNLMAKIMMQIPTTALKLYSSVGVATIHREDLLLNDWRWSPAFGMGLNANISEHIMAEIDGNYTAGFGESQLNPTNTYFPFLYAVTFRLAYRFG